MVVAGGLLFSGCEEEEESERENSSDPGDECEQVGEPASCDCENGFQGSRVCLADGSYTACNCSGSGSTSCQQPGAEIGCACPNGGQGTRFCLRDRSLSACDCSAASAVSGAAGAAGAAAAGSPSGGSEGCPQGFSCVDMQGFQICVDSSGIPPFCQTDDDCANEGLTGAMCTDPGVGTKVCVQLC